MRIKRANASFLQPTQKYFDAIIASKYFYQTIELMMRVETSTKPAKFQKIAGKRLVL
jgi:hypothetical protein